MYERFTDRYEFTQEIEGVSNINKINLDYLFNQLHKRQRYLMFRFLILTFIVLFTYKPILESTNSSLHLFFNASLLFIAPIFLEYLLGMEAHNIITNITRIFGFFFTATVILFCVIGLMGGLSGISDEYGYITGFNIYTLDVSISVFKSIYFIIPGLAFIDFVFTLNTREIKYYQLKDSLDLELKKIYAQTKKDQTFDKKVSEMKTQLRGLTNDIKGGES